MPDIQIGLMAKSLLPDPWPACHFIGDEEIQYILRVLHGRSPSRFMGPNVQNFAEALEKWYIVHLGRDHAIAVSSGSNALSICLTALNIGPGDEVLVPSYAWAACYNTIIRSGAIPRIVEINETLTLDPDDLLRKIGSHSKAVLLVHMNGGCGDVQRFVDICKEYRLLLIEDVCQANGGMFDDRPLGSFGDMAIFSFQMNKTITGGEGGLIVCDDELLWQRAWMCHDQGYWRTPSSIDSRNDLPIVSMCGFGMHISELTAAMVLAQTEILNKIVCAMQVRQQLLYDGLKKLPNVQFRPGTVSKNDIGNSLVMIWPDRNYCEKTVIKTRSAGVCTSTGFGNLMLSETGLHVYYNNSNLVNKVPTHSSGRPWNDPLNYFASDYSYRKGSLPLTDQILERVQLLYVSPVLTEEEIQNIVSIFHHYAD